MAGSKKTSEAINFKAAGRKIRAIDQTFKNPEFQKVVSQLVAAKSESDRVKIAESSLTQEALAKSGIDLPAGIKVMFKPASASSTTAQRKKIVVNLVIPEVGTITFRSGLKDKQEAAQDEK